VVNVDRLEAARPQILEGMRYAGWAENDLARACIKRRIPDKKSCMALDDDKGLVIRVHVKTWPGTDFIRTISKHRHRPA
jgi:hypothetical protein